MGGPRIPDPWISETTDTGAVDMGPPVALFVCLFVIVVVGCGYWRCH